MPLPATTAAYPPLPGVRRVRRDTSLVAPRAAARDDSVMGGAKSQEPAAAPEWLATATPRRSRQYAPAQHLPPPCRPRRRHRRCRRRRPVSRPAYATSRFLVCHHAKSNSLPCTCDEVVRMRARFSRTYLCVDLCCESGEKSAARTPVGWTRCDACPVPARNMHIGPRVCCLSARRDSAESAEK